METAEMKRKGRIAAAFALLAAIAAFACARGAGGKTEQYTATFYDVFDTQTQIIGYASSEDEFAGQVALIQEKFQYYNELYDIYNDYDGVNNVKTVNDSAGIAPVEVDSEIIALLALGIEMADETGGKVNIAMGSVLSVWHDYREAGNADAKNAALPSMELLEEAARHTDIANIVIDGESSTVYLADSEMSIDVGSIAKGYAVQKVAEYARDELGMEHFLISAGGNVCAVGGHPDGTDWVVGIQNPDTDSDAAYVQKVAVSGASVVTSGDYQRYYTVDGVRYCHIIDPDTLMPAAEFSSVTVIAETSGFADALSTALFNMTLPDGMELVAGTDGVEAMWILKDGTIQYSDGFAEYTD